MASTVPYVEETFGILTDDQLYLDCVLVRPQQTSDEQLRVLRVWVPKFPLTKSSVINCARQEVKSYGPKGRIAHLVFDLRGTGESDGVLGDQNYDMDLHGIEEWAKERFGSLNFGFLGFPTIEEFAKVNVWPLRAGAVMETYHYPAASAEVSSTTVVYLSSYGNFRRRDQALCVALADAGYDVFGLDPLRYLLHASTQTRLTREQLAEDMRELIQMLPGLPIVVGQPLAAGLALMWGIEVERVRGVIGIGPAQAGLAPKHVFDNDNPLHFQLGRHIPKLAPRPVVFVNARKRQKASHQKELETLFQLSGEPHQLETVERVTPEAVLGWLQWLEENEP